MNKILARLYSDLTEKQWYEVRYEQGFITKNPPFNLKGRKRNLLDVKVNKKAVHAYPVLVEGNGQRVTQAEHTFIPNETGVTITTIQ